jgi:hypothetical protein
MFGEMPCSKSKTLSVSQILVANIKTFDLQFYLSPDRVKGKKQTDWFGSIGHAVNGDAAAFLPRK